MAKINEITQMTETKFLNLYHVKGVNKKGYHSNYYVASRAKHIEDLKITTRKNRPDGVLIYSLYGENRDRVVLERQYRYTVDDYVYELPAGLVEEGENFRQAAVRELHEETGLHLDPIEVDPMYEEPRFTSIGMTDESCATVYGYASGKVSEKFEELSEEIEIVIADREEVRRILREEKVAIVCAYHLFHFLSDEKPFAFLEKKD